MYMVKCSFETIDICSNTKYDNRYVLCVCLLFEVSESRNAVNICWRTMHGKHWPLLKHTKCMAGTHQSC